MNRTIWNIAGGILLFLSSAIVCAQESVNLPLVVQSGDRLVVEYSHERNQNGQIVTGNVVAEIVIGDVGDDSFSATWRTGSIDVGGVRIDMDSPEAAALMLGVPILYIADSDGTPVRIDDKNRVLDTLLASPVISSEVDASMRSLFDSMSEEALAQLFLRVPAYMALCQGTNLPLGVRNEAMVQIPSPLGGAPIDAEASYVLKSFDEQRGRANIEYRRALDPEGAKKLIADLLDQVAGPDEPLESEIAGLTIEQNDTASCEVSAENGLAESVRYFTETKVLDQFKSETIVISSSYIPIRADRVWR